MSWFSNRFATSQKGSDGGDGDQDDEYDLQGNSVKDDLSELTKTLKRQLWGVASFLAPPPSTTPSVEEEDPSPSFSNYLAQPGPEIHCVSQPGEISFGHELVDVDIQASVDPVVHLQEEVLDRPDVLRRSEISSGLEVTHVAPDRGLTGIGKDLAELKGSVATGFTKLLKVVREEIDRNEHAEVGHDYKYNEEEEDEENDDEDDEPKELGSAKTIPVFDSFFKPFLGGVYQYERDDMPQESGTGDDPDDKGGHQKYRPSGAMNLGRTLSKSLGSVSKLASTLFPVNLDSDNDLSAAESNSKFEAVGVTEDVLAFVKNISMHPETWLDFPLFTGNDEDDDFEMYDAQKDHVLEVERASPRLAALRIELCPGYMSESRFWKIYFVLLHSRLNKKDAMLLSTPQIMKARSLLLSNLQKNECQERECANDQQWDLEKSETPGYVESFKIVSLQSALEVPAKDFDQAEIANQDRLHSSGDNTGSISDEVQNKNVLVNTVKLATVTCEEEEADVERWLHEESSLHFSMPASTRLANDDDVSFSDLEEDDDSLPAKGAGSSNLQGTQGWVELNKDQKAKCVLLAEGGLDYHEKIELASKIGHRRESNDWLTVDEELDFT